MLINKGRISLLKMFMRQIRPQLNYNREILLWQNLQYKTTVKFNCNLIVVLFVVSCENLLFSFNTKNVILYQNVMFPINITFCFDKTFLYIKIYCFITNRVIAYCVLTQHDSLYCLDQFGLNQVNLKIFPVGLWLKIFDTIYFSCVIVASLLPKTWTGTP